MQAACKSAYWLRLSSARITVVVSFACPYSLSFIDSIVDLGISFPDERVSVVFHQHC